VCVCVTIGDGSAQAVGCRLQAAAGASPREEEVRAPLTHSLTHSNAYFNVHSTTHYVPHSHTLSLTQARDSASDSPESYSSSFQARRLGQEKRSEEIQQ
jgi:hypothetical protein